MIEKYIIIWYGEGYNNIMKINFKIRNKLIIYFLLAILIPTLIITSIIYVRSSNIINKKTDELIQKNINSASLTIKQRFEFINELTTLISLNPIIKKVLSSDETSEMEKNINEIIMLDRALDSYYLSNYYLISPSSTVPIIYLVSKPEYKDYNISSKVQDISEIDKEDWYYNIKDDNITIITNVNKDQITLFRRLYDLKNIDKISYAALLRYDIDKRYFSELLSEYRISPGTHSYIIDKNGEIIITCDNDTKDSQEILHSYLNTININNINSIEQIAPTREYINDQSLVVSIGKLGISEWYIINFTYSSEIISDISHLRDIVYILLAISMTFALIVAFTFSKNISNPIEKLVKSMRSIEDNNFNTLISYERDDEFGFLINQYNLMISQIKELIQQLSISERNKRKAQINEKDANLRALQSQINPHFLYNTLDYINLYAIKYNIPIISEMITSLSDFFRYGLNQGKYIITLKEEILHVKSYLKILNMRFNKEINCIITIPTAIYKSHIVKLTLQPLIENAVLHGLNKSVNDWIITISAEQVDDKILITIYDNGIGADAEHLNSLLDIENKYTKSFGINNVQQRLQKAFGSEFGLKYYNIEKEGITVIVTIPNQIH